LAGLDFVAGGEHGFLNLCAIKLCSVGAALVDDAAAIGATLNGEVNAGHVIVMGDGELGAVGGAADEESLTGWNRNLSAREGSTSDFKNQAHSEDSKHAIEANQTTLS